MPRATVTPIFDWSADDGTPEDVVMCPCGRTFASHTRHAQVGGRHSVYMRTPCPRCGREQDPRAVIPGAGGSL